MEGFYGGVRGIGVARQAARLGGTLPDMRWHGVILHTSSHKVLDLPPEVESVFREFRTCEMSTLARDGAPIT